MGVVELVGVKKAGGRGGGAAVHLKYTLFPCLFSALVMGRPCHLPLLCSLQRLNPQPTHLHMLTLFIPHPHTHTLRQFCNSGAARS